jgi:hypothetical protein
MALYLESLPQPSYHLRLRRMEDKADRDEGGR